MATRTSRLTPFRLTAMLLALVLLIGVGVVAWQVFGTSWLSGRRAEQAMEQARTQWQSGKHSIDPAPGSVVAIITIADLHLTWPVISGTGASELDHGLGWYPNTALPTDAGNMVVSGYRLGHGAPLAHLDRLAKGSTITIESASGRHQYRTTTAPALVTASDSWPLDPVPGHRDQPPTDHLLTLVTSADVTGGNQRVVVFASQEPR